MDYTMVVTGPSAPEQGPSEPGFINGGMYARTPGFPGTAPTIVVDVASIDEALRKVGEAGGRIVRGKTPLGEMGFTGYFTDTEGNLIGLWQNA